LGGWTLEVGLLAAALAAGLVPYYCSATTTSHYSDDFDGLEGGEYGLWGQVDFAN
jgi:hypothetical protein